MTRRDYLNDPNARKANSIAVAVSAFVQDEEGRILMIRRTDNGLYSIPGGQVEPGETLTEATVREVKEETGIEIEVTGLIGLYSNPNHVIAYDDGEIRQEFSICFRAHRRAGRQKTSDESSDVRWIEPDDLDGLAIHPSTRLRLEHAIADRSNPYYT